MRLTVLGRFLEHGESEPLREAARGPISSTCRGHPRFELTTNSDTIETYLEGFRRSDHAMVLSCLTDDVEWDIPGLFHVRGKQAFDDHIEEDGFIGPPEITVSRLTEVGDIVFVEGEVRGARSDGARFRLAICDVFEMRSGKIRHLTSYLMEMR